MEADSVYCRFELLKVLTDNGKKVEYIEEIIGPFLLKWMPEVHSTGRYVHVMWCVNHCGTNYHPPTQGVRIYLPAYQYGPLQCCIS